MGICGDVFGAITDRILPSKSFRISKWDQRGALWRYRAYTLINSMLDLMLCLGSVAFVVIAKRKACNELGYLDTEFCGFFSTYECSNYSYTIMLALPMAEGFVYSIRIMLRLLWVKMTSSVQHKLQYNMIESSSLRKRVRRIMKIQSVVSIFVIIEVFLLTVHMGTVAQDKCRDRFTGAGTYLVKKCRWHHLYCLNGFASHPSWDLVQDTTSNSWSYYLKQDKALDEVDKSWSRCNQKEYLYSMAQWWENPSIHNDDPNNVFSFIFADDYDAWLFKTFRCPEETDFDTKLNPPDCPVPCSGLSVRISSLLPYEANMAVWEKKFLDQTDRISKYRLTHQCFLFTLIWVFCWFYFVFFNHLSFSFKMPSVLLYC